MPVESRDNEKKNIMISDYNNFIDDNWFIDKFKILILAITILIFEI